MLSELFNLEKISGVCEKVCYFFVINLLFLISNIPVLLFFLFIGISNVRIYLPLFLVCMIPMAPALTAVFYGMNKLLQGIEKNAVHDFWSGYRSGFVQKLKLSAGQLLLLFIFWTNIEFFTKQFFVLPAVILFILLFAFTILITPYLYLLHQDMR